MAKFRRSLALSFIDKYITFVFSIVTIAVLARILTPAQTGIFSVAVGLINLAQTIREFGVCNYVLKETALSREKLATALGLSLLSGIGLALAFASMSGWIARWFEEPEIKSVVLVMSMNFVIVAFGSIGWAQLQRKMDFSAMTRISITAVIARSVVGIGMAYLGYGAMAMAWSSIAGTLISLVGSYLALGRERLIMPRLSAWRPLIRFGAASTGASLLQMVIFSAPDVIVGRFLGLTQAGFLSRARSLTTLFENGFMAAIRPVAVTSLAQASREGRAMGELYLKFLDHTIVIAWPILLLLAVLAEPIILIGFGDQWANAIPASRLLCLAAGIMLIVDLAGSAMIAVGAMRQSLFAYGIATPVYLALIVFGCNFGIEGAAVGICVGILLLAVLSQWQANKILNVLWVHVNKIVFRTIAAVCITSVLPMFIVITRHDTGFAMQMTTLFLGGFCGASSWLAFIFISRHPLRDEITAFYQQTLNFLAGLRSR